MDERNRIGKPVVAALVLVLAMVTLIVAIISCVLSIV